MPLKLSKSSICSRHNHLLELFISPLGKPFFACKDCIREIAERYSNQSADPQAHGMRYKKYLLISANQIVAKRDLCKQHIYDEVVLYERCKKCGSYHPFRNPKDVKRRGVMPDMGDDTYEESPLE